MFQIDLLNGAGRPPRSHPLRIAAATVIFLILIVAAAFDGVYLYGLRRELTGRRQAVARLDRQIADMADVAKMLEAAAKEKAQIDASMAEVAQLAGRQAAWSPILVALTERTPKEIVINEILAKREEPKGTQQKAGPAYSLVIGVTSPLGAGAVEQFIAALRQALPLRPGINSIQILSQRHQETDGQTAQYYIIECQLKP